MGGGGVNREKESEEAHQTVIRRREGEGLLVAMWVLYRSLLLLWSPAQRDFWMQC